MLLHMHLGHMCTHPSTLTINNTLTCRRHTMHEGMATILRCMGPPYLEEGIQMNTQTYVERWVEGQSHAHMPPPQEDPWSQPESARSSPVIPQNGRLNETDMSAGPESFHAYAQPPPQHTWNSSTFHSPAYAQSHNGSTRPQSPALTANTHYAPSLPAGGYAHCGLARRFTCRIASSQASRVTYAPSSRHGRGFPQSWKFNGDGPVCGWASLHELRGNPQSGMAEGPEREEGLVQRVGSTPNFNS